MGFWFGFDFAGNDFGFDFQFPSWYFLAGSGGGFVVGLGWLSATKGKTKEKLVWYGEREEKNKKYIFACKQ